MTGDFSSHRVQPQTTAPTLKATSRECPVCGHGQAEVLNTQHFVVAAEKSVPDQYDVVVCTACGAAYADSDIPQQQYDQLYTAGSRYAAGPAAHTNERDLARFRDVAAVIRNAVPDLAAQIVDIGCANGQLLQALSEQGYSSLIGVDPSPSCVQQAERIPCVRAFVGSLSYMPNALSPCNVAVLSHVLEHVRDVYLALEHLKRHLRRGGLLYVEVPDAARYADYAWSPFQDFNTEHINHFSAISLANVLRRAGFRVATVVQKDLLPAPGMPYPAIYTLATLDESAAADVQRDVDLRTSLGRYVQVSQDLLNAIEARLAPNIDSGQPLVIWGTGELTSKLLATTSLRHANIRGFVDANPANQGCRLWGHTILAPSELTPGNETIVVASILHYNAIRRDIRARGLRNPVLGLGGHADDASTGGAQ